MFGARESAHSLDLSPDGTKIVYVAPAANAMSVITIADLKTNDAKPILQSKEEISWCNFVGNSRLICRVHGVADFEGKLVNFSRLRSLDIDGKNIKALGQERSFYDSRIRQFDGDVLDWLPGDGSAVLMARDYVPEAGRTGSHITRTKDGYGVDRVDVTTLKSTVVEPPVLAATDFITDGRGHVRIMETQPVSDATGLLNGRTVYRYRKDGAAQWSDFSTYDSVTNDGTIPIAIDADLDAAYALKKLNGRFALYRVKLDGSLATELVYANDKVDVDNVVRVGKGARVIGVTFAEEQRRVIYFDPEFTKLAAGLSKAIPNLPLVDFVGSNADNSKLLLFAGSDADPGRYYLYDNKSHTLNELMLARPELENAKLTVMKPVSYPAGDGVSVPAYLSVPPGKDARNLPTVIMPHGGPSARDEWGFDWLAQYLVSKGYAVLQPNYRGSAGYGDAWMAQNGFRGWRTSIGDITAGARWMVAQGIADPKRLAIVGWSYGGYAALQSGVAEPGLYKAIVAIAPVTDLQMVKNEAEGFTNATLVSKFVGVGPHVREGSPLQNVDKIQVPVLLFHGDRDTNVGIAESQRMDRALRDAGKKSELIEFPGLDHQLDDSAARTRMLERIGSFLGETVGS